MFNYSDSEFEDDVIIMASQGILSNRDCVVLLSPDLDYPCVDQSMHATSNHPFKHRKTHIRPQSATKSNSEPAKTKLKPRVQNTKSSRKKSSNLTISKTLFSPVKSNEEKMENLSLRKKEVKSNRSNSKKSPKKRRNICSRESDNDSSDLEDPSIILKQLTGDSKIPDDNIIDETMSDDDLLITASLPSTHDSCVKSGPRHSSPIKDTQKARKIFDGIRKENTRMKLSQIEPYEDSIEISDNDVDTDFSQSFIKCSQEPNSLKDRMENKKAVSKRPLLSLKTATVAAALTEPVSRHSSDSDLEDPSLNLKRLTTDSQNIKPRNDVHQWSDDDLFLSQESTDILETKSFPEVVSLQSPKPYKLSENSDTTIECTNNDIQSFSFKKVTPLVRANSSEQNTALEVPSIERRESCVPEERDQPVSSDLEKNILSRKGTISTEDSERDSESLLAKETSLTSNTSMPDLSPQTSLVIQRNLSSDTSIPHLSQYLSDTTPKKETLNNAESIPKPNRQIERSSTICSYSLEADVVAVFDSEDEELFLTQSVIDRSVTENPEFTVKDEDVSEEEMWLSNLCWDNRSGNKKPKKIEIDEETQLLSEECGPGTSVQTKTTPNNNYSGSTCLVTGSDEEGDESAKEDDDEDSATESDDNKCYTVQLNIYRPPTPEDFKHILYPEKSSSVKRCRRKERSPPLDDNKRRREASVNLHPQDFDKNISNKGKGSLATTSDATLSIKASDSLTVKDENVDSTNSFGLSTQVSGENENAEDVDLDVYLAQTQIDYMVISSDDESSGGANHIEDSPSSSSTVDPGNIDDGIEPISDFEEDIDVLDMQSSTLKEEPMQFSETNAAFGHDSDVYITATQIDSHEMNNKDPEKDSSEADSNFQLYLLDTQMDEKLTETADAEVYKYKDNLNTEKEVTPTPTNDISDAENIDAYLMDTQIDDDSPLEIKEVDVYEVATQIDPDEHDNDLEDPYEAETLEMDNNENLPDVRDSSYHIPSDRVTEARYSVNEDHESNDVTASISLIDKAKSGSTSLQSASKAMNSRLVSRISEDADVSEKNIVEYMMSTQVEVSPNTNETDSRLDNTSISSRKTLKLPAITKGLFDIFSESSNRLSEDKVNDTISSSSSSSIDKSKNRSWHTNKGNKDELCRVQSPNLFSLFMPDNSSKTGVCDSKLSDIDKEINKRFTSSAYDPKDDALSLSKESKKRVHPDSASGEIVFQPPPPKKMEVSRKTQVVPPIWMSSNHSAVEKSAHSGNSKHQRSASESVKPVRKRRNSNKTVEETLSSSIALAKKRFDERFKSGGALTKHSAGKDMLLLMQSNISDVEMPNTQEIMEQGLPILNMISPVVKKTSSANVQTKCSKPCSNTMPGVGSTSTHYSSLPTAAASTTSTSSSTLASTGVVESSTKSLSSTSISGTQSKSVDQQTQQLPSGNQTKDSGKDSDSIRKISSLSKSVYLHKDTLSSGMPNPVITGVPLQLPGPVSNANQDMAQGNKKSSVKKTPSLSRSIYLHKDSSNNNDIPKLINDPAPLSGPLSIVSSHSITSPHSSPITTTKSLPMQSTSTTYSSSSPLISSSSTLQPTVSIHSTSNMQVPPPSVSLTIPVTSANHCIVSSVISLEMEAPSSIQCAPVNNPVLTSSSIVTTASKVQAPIKGSTSAITSVITTSLSVSANTIPTVTSTCAVSSTNPTVSTNPKSFGAMIRKPKQRKGILKTAKGVKFGFKSIRVRFDDSRNTIRLIEKVESRPPLQHIDSTTKKMNKEPFRTPNQFIQGVLKWSTSWIFEQESVNGHPPIIEPGVIFSRLRMAYEDVRTYQDITYKLFLLEVWAMLSSDWKSFPTFLPTFIKAKPQYFNQGDEHLGLLSMEVEGVSLDHQTVPMVSDVVVLSMQGKVKGSNQETTQAFEQFGFVEGVRATRIEQNKNSVLYRPEIKGNFKESLKPGAFIFSARIRFKFRNLVPCDLMKMRRVGSLTTALRQFQGLVEFAQTPLSPALINPDPWSTVFSLDDSLAPDESLLKCLNKEQAFAVTQIREAVLTYPNHPRVCLLQGPPGTGKSYVIMVLIHQILMNSRFGAKICLAAPSNAAVDEIASRIIDLSEKKCKPRNSPAISIVRLGNIDNVSKDIKPYHISSLTDKLLKQDQHNRVSKTLLDELKAVDSKISSLTAELKDIRISEAQKVANRKELNRLSNQDKKKLEEEMKPSYQDKRKAKYSVINNCHVVCGTLSSFGSGETMPLLRFRNTNQERREPFTCLIVDEATQAVELDCLIPLQHQVNKLVLVGDQQQLPATVLSQEAKNCRFDASLFQRLHDKFESCKDDAANPVMLLKEQYRMHPEILKLPNSYFYKNLLITAQSRIKSRMSNLSPYLVFDILDGMEISGNYGSKSNLKEAKCVALLCQNVVNLLTTKNSASQHQRKIGVICPYADQKIAIRDSLRTLGLYNILVNTVDSFQGQEKDIIILSCVRAKGQVGFVDDGKRMNVALTRAKLALYIVGHRKTLNTSGLWRLLYEDAENRGLLAQVPKTEMFAEIAAKRVPLPIPFKSRR